MAYSLENTTDLTALGNAIRTKTGGSGTMTVAEMATAVDSISVGGTERDTYWTGWGYGGTNIGASGGYIYKQINTTLTLTLNNAPTEKFYLTFMSCPQSYPYNSSSMPKYYFVTYDNGTTTVKSGGNSSAPTITVSITRTAAGKFSVVLRSNTSGYIIGPNTGTSTDPAGYYVNCFNAR